MGSPTLDGEMKTYIYMNHFIYDKKNHKAKNPEPALTVQTGDKRIYCNEVAINGPSVIRYGTMLTPGHKVHGWLETNSRVEILS